MPFLTLPNEIFLEISYWQSLVDQSSLFRTNKRLSHLIPQVLLDTVFRTCSKEHGRRALYHYASRNDSASVHALLDRGVISFAGTAPSVIIGAMETKNEITLRTLLDCGVSAAGVGGRGLTPVQFAARTGKAGMMRLLLSKEEYGIDVIAVSEVEPAALIYAAAFGFPEVVRLLLGHPEIEVNALGPHQCSALNSAIVSRRLCTLKLLLADSRVDLSSRNGSVWNALMNAVWTQHKETVELLLQNPRIDISNPGPVGETALHIAVDCKDTAILRMLLKQAMVNVNTVTISGCTPLHRASFLNEEAVSVLLEDGRADINARDNSGRVTSGCCEASR
ncbi:ankyrin repeat-containing domain protein [Tuber brumale]|nr:ankyrin repeat-containing domain protein [Tuber brumale]